MAADQQTIVYLGNRHPVQATRNDDGELVRTAMPRGKHCTTVTAPPGTPLAEVFTSITAPTGGVWHFHSDGPPAWVASTSPQLAALLADHYQCQLRDPDPDPGSDGAEGAPADEHSTKG